MPDAIRYITIPEFAARTTLCRSSIYNLVVAGDLPRPTRIYPTQRVAFPESVLTEYLARVARLNGEGA